MKEERGNILWQIILPLGCTCIIIALMLFGFSNQIRSSEVLSFENTLRDIADKYAQKVQSDVQTISSTGAAIAQVIAGQSEFGSSNEIVGQSLTALMDQTEIYSALLYDENGQALNQNGEVLNIKETDYTANLVHPREIKYIYLNNDSRTDEGAIIILLPVVPEKETLALFYPMRRFSSLTEASNEFDQSAFVIMMSGDGKILHKDNTESNFLSGSNLWNSIDKECAGKLPGVKVKMQNKSSGCVALESDGEKRTIVFSSLNLNDWILAIGVNQSYVEKREIQKWNETSQMLYQLVAVIILCILVLFIINVTTKMRTSERSRLIQEKMDMDQLTGLNNKLATERKIKEFLEENPDNMAMLFVLDIDNFKKINDTMGHAFGDEVLRTLGRQISSNFRVTDIVGRTGGDEFIVLLKNLKDDESVLREARKLVYFFKNFQVGEYVKYSATASIGAAIYPADGRNFETLYKSADSALYKAKKNGKNQLAFYDQRKL